MNTTFETSLPLEVWEKILLDPRLDLKDTYNIMRVSSDFRGLVQKAPILKVGQFYKWVIRILRDSSGDDFFLLQKLGALWIKACESYFEKRSEGTLVPFKKFANSVTQFRNIFSDILSEQAIGTLSAITPLWGCKKLPPKFFLEKMFLEDVDYLEGKSQVFQSTELATLRGNRKQTQYVTTCDLRRVIKSKKSPLKETPRVSLMDMSKLSSICPNAFTSDVDRTRIEQLLFRATQLEPSKSVWTIRPSGSEPGKMVCSQIFLRKGQQVTEHVLIEKRGLLTECLKIFMSTGKSMLQVFEDHKVPVDPRPDLTEEQLGSINQKLWEEVTKLHDDKIATFMPTINRNEAECLLKNQNNSFLVRYQSSQNDENDEHMRRFVLSMNIEGIMQHFKINIEPKTGKLSICMALYDDLNSFLKYAKSAGFIGTPYQEESAEETTTETN